MLSASTLERPCITKIQKPFVVIDRVSFLDVLHAGFCLILVLVLALANVSHIS